MPYLLLSHASNATQQGVGTFAVVCQTHDCALPLKTFVEQEKSEELTAESVEDDVPDLSA